MYRDERNELVLLSERLQHRINKLRTIVQKLPLYGLAEEAHAEPQASPKAQTQRGPSHVTVNVHAPVGTLNTGEVLGNIHSHVSTVTGMSAADFRSAITEFARVIGENRDLPEQRRKAVLETIDLVAEEANQPPEKRRLEAIQLLLLAIPALVDVSNVAVQAWNTYGPAIRAYLGL